MKLNQKGITLTELIVSIALISIVIMFLFRLLVDVRYNENNIDFNRANQQTRAIVLKTIQKDFLEKKLIKITDRTQNSGEFLLEFTFQDHSTGRLSVLRDTLTYTTNETTEKWLLEKETENAHFGINCVNYNTSVHSITNGEFFFIKFTIPVIINKQKNYLDDLEFFYLGERKDILLDSFPNKSYLGYYDAKTCG